MWGFGEKFTHFNKRGQRIECWQKDALSTNSEDSYKGHPYFTSSRGYSILLNTFTRSSFDMGASSWISYQIGSNDPVLDYIFLAEDRNANYHQAQNEEKSELFIFFKYS